MVSVLVALEAIVFPVFISSVRSNPLEIRRHGPPCQQNFTNSNGIIYDIYCDVDSLPFQSTLSEESSWSDCFEGCDALGADCTSFVYWPPNCYFKNETHGFYSNPGATAAVQVYFSVPTPTSANFSASTGFQPVNASSFSASPTNSSLGTLPTAFSGIKPSQANATSTMSGPFFNSKPFATTTAQAVNKNDAWCRKLRAFYREDETRIARLRLEHKDVPSRLYDYRAAITKIAQRLNC